MVQLLLIAGLPLWLYQNEPLDIIQSATKPFDLLLQPLDRKSTPVGVPLTRVAIVTLLCSEVAALAQVLNAAK